MCVLDASLLFSILELGTKMASFVVSNLCLLLMINEFEEVQSLYNLESVKVIFTGTQVRPVLRHEDDFRPKAVGLLIVPSARSSCPCALRFS